MTIFFNFSPTSNHLHPLQAKNCDSNSRLVVDEDDNGKLERVNYHSNRVFITYILYSFVINIDHLIIYARHICILYQKHFHAHCDVIISDVYIYITDKVRIREEDNTVSVQCSNSPLLVKNNAIQIFNEHWYLNVKNTEVHDGTLNFITAIKLSDTDNVVVVGADVNLLILLSKRSHHSNT